MKKIRQTTLLATFTGALLFAAVAYGDDKKADPAGTWTWTMPGRNGGADRTNTLTLKVADSKLTGKISAPGRDGQASERDIADAKVEGEKVSFAVVREFNGNSMTNKYTGKIEGDKIVGKMTYRNRDGEEQSRDWEAKRADKK